MRYCFWSVVGPDSAGRAQDRIREARGRGVVTDFVIFSDSELEGASTFSLYELDVHNKLFPLVYLSAGISTLNYDAAIYFDFNCEIVSDCYEIDRIFGPDPIVVPLGFEPLLADSMAIVQSARRIGLNKPWRRPNEGLLMTKIKAVPIILEIASALQANLRADSEIEFFELMGTVGQILSGSNCRLIREQQREVFSFFRFKSEICPLEAIRIS